MGCLMKAFTSSLNKICKNESLRLDFGIRYVDDILDFNPLGIKEKYILLGDVLTELKSKKYKKGDLPDEYYLVDLENINKRFNSLVDLEKVQTIDSDKTLLSKGDLVIAKMTPKLGTMFLNAEHKEYVGSTELVEYKIDGYDKKSLYYLLTTNKYLDTLGYMESGKNQRRVKPSDLLKLKIPVSCSEISDYLEKSDAELSSMFSKKENMYKIIDDAFKSELSINQIKTKKQLKTDLSMIGDDNLCRFSFHNQNYYKTFEFRKLEGDLWCPIESKFLVKGGKRIPKGETFSSDITEYFYLRPTEVSIVGMDRDNFPYISEKIHALLKNYSISSGEYCISNVGTLGKVGLVHLDELDIKEGNLILSENFVKLVPKESINEKFYYYYFNSYIFQKQIEREYTITSIMKLGLDKVKKIAIPKFEPETESKIIDSIEAKLEDQRKLLQEIDKKRIEIDNKFYSLIS